MLLVSVRPRADAGLEVPAEAGLEFGSDLKPALNDDLVLSAARSHVDIWLFCAALSNVMGTEAVQRSGDGDRVRGPGEKARALPQAMHEVIAAEPSLSLASFATESISGASIATASRRYLMLEAKFACCSSHLLYL